MVSLIDWVIGGAYHLRQGLWWLGNYQFKEPHLASRVVKQYYTVSNRNPQEYFLATFRMHKTKEESLFLA